jgi:ribonuclease T2
MTVRVLIGCLWLSLAPAALAFVPVQGEFVARQACPATRGIHAKPDGVEVRTGERYAALGLNRPQGDRLQIRVPGARPESRWVGLDCGDLTPVNSGGRDRSAMPVPYSKSGKLLLSLSWHYAFCETKPEKPECRDQATNAAAADQFVLHGLWPQPQGLEYCNVSERERALDERRHWRDLPDLSLQPATRERLRRAMPGTASGLERHEWVRHGSCFASDADLYYRTALGLVEQVNQSALREAFVGRLGQWVTLDQLRAAFERSFGPGTGTALGLRCSRDGDRQLISEIRIKLRQPLDDATKLSAALDRSSPERGNCSAGEVDRVGLQ